MGSENHFHKRKARKNAEFERQKNVRSQSKRYLIVCEGTKTEPYYLKDLVEDLRIRPSSVRIAPNSGSSPDRVVAHGLTLYEDDAKTGDRFDQVYCVFDKDKHSTYANAVQRTRDLTASGVPFVAITSVPCFEYWLLLHFGFTDKPFESAGSKSACEKLISILRTKPNLKSYGKGNSGVYAALRDKTGIAIEAAGRLTNGESVSCHRNPSTRVYELVQTLQALVS
jgi:RloB-like protein